MSTDPRARQALQLLREGKRAEAQAILDGLLRQYPNDADLWYLAAGAAQGDKRIEYLNRVLHVDPSHTKARAMLDKLAPPAPAAPLMPPVSIPPAPIPADRSRSNPLLWLLIGLVVLLLIGASGFGGYQLGHDAGLRDLGRTMAVAFYGNEASQTAYPVRMATLDAESTVQRASFRETATALYAAYTREAAEGDATRSAIEQAYGATSTAMYMAATAEAQLRFATQTAAAPKPISSMSEVVVVPGKYQTANWSIEVAVSPMDDSTETTARLRSDGTDIFNSSSFTIECKNSEFTVHFNLDSVLLLSDQPVQIRLDKEPMRILKPTEYIMSSFIGLASPRTFLGSLVGHDQLTIAVGEFTSVTFTITNIDIASAFPLKTCGF